MNNESFIKSAMNESKKRTFSPLYLLSLIYGFVLIVRRFFYRAGIFKSRRINACVISIGNIAVGGTGKTPTVIYVAKLLNRHGYKVCVLSRGYKGTNKDEYLEVSNETDVLSDPITAGDEPYMLAKSLKGVPVIVGKNRYVAGKRAVEKFKPDVCILDDGFQHLKLKRDINIVTFDGDVGAGNGRLIPAGILREQVSALKRADIILINKGDKKYNEIVSLVSKYKGDSGNIFRSRYEIDGLTSLKGDNESIEYLSGKRIFAFSALANANYFYEIIKNAGGIVSGKLEYDDHYYYNQNDYNNIINNAKLAKAQLILTTEKDIVKINGAWADKNHIDMFSLNIRLKPVD